ncbi:MAG: hypothetical protein ACM3VX_04085 [Bacteroidota bacterium]
MDRRLDYDADKAAHAGEIRKRVAVGASFRPPKTHSSRRARSLDESLLLIAAARRAWREAVVRGEIREVGPNRVEIRW